MPITTPALQTEIVAIPLPADLVAMYRTAPNELRRKWHVLIEIYLRRFQSSTAESLDRTLREIGEEALASGLTERELNEILQDEDDAERR